MKMDCNGKYKLSSLEYVFGIENNPLDGVSEVGKNTKEQRSKIFDLTIIS